MTPTEAAEKMREDALSVIDDIAARWRDSAIDNMPSGLERDISAWTEVADDIHAAIRAMPLPAAEPWAPPEDRHGFTCLGWWSDGDCQVVTYHRVGDFWTVNTLIVPKPRTIAPLPPEPRP